MLYNYDNTNKLVHGCFQPYHLLQCWLANETNPYCCAHVRGAPKGRSTVAPGVNPKHFVTSPEHQLSPGHAVSFDYSNL